MENFNGNPYYNPAECGLEMIDSVELEPDYDFHIIAVWRDTETNKFYYASDSGCSCPTPFEDYNELAALSPLNDQTWDEFRAHVKGFATYKGGDAERRQFLSRVRRVYTRMSKGSR